MKGRSGTGLPRRLPQPTPAEVESVPAAEIRPARFFPLGEGGRPRGAQAERVLCGVFFLSGAAALVFETLWFRRAGLAFGNGVWASALVLSSFMAGLALGNGLAARIGERVARPERLYAKLEVLVAGFALGLVVLFPHVSAGLTPLWRAIGEAPVLVNSLRLAISFALLLVPATAMGMTLPILVKALARGGGGFGSALGRLYGWNTLGAVAGALAAEVALIEAFGVVGAGICAAGLNVLAAFGAVRVAPPAPGGERDDESTPAAVEPQSRPTPFDGSVRRALAASFVAGGALLALEVVWFRFLQLFSPGTSLTFAVMLAVVLAGIGLGGLAASAWFRRDPRAHRRAGSVALAGGLVAVLGYATVGHAVDVPVAASLGKRGLEVLLPCLVLTFPLSLLSGVLFSLVGGRVREALGSDTRAAGLVTLANTLGATIGPLVAGFALIPWLGMEKSLFLLVLAYAGVALLLGRPRGRAGHAVVAAYGLALLVFPFGAMQRHLAHAREDWMLSDTRVVATREGTVETIQYLQRDYLGEPAAHRLVTNGYSMASTETPWRRYMKAYVYWPVAVHPDLSSACLISFGTGSTAKALTDIASLESIAVVDISREILEMADVAFPEPGSNPLDDPRVETFVEDGRFFLQTTDRTFDLITSEPPPPKMAGVVNLYTEEYFRLVHDRLAEGGIATYWLPVVQFSEREMLAVTRAFLNVFGEGTTLWTGSAFEWMLVGSKGLGPVTRAHFEAQWHDPDVLPELRALGFERPHQLGSTFLADAPFLERLTAGVPPLDDDHPRRLGAELAADPASVAVYRELMRPEAAFLRFRESAFVRRVWPPSLVAEAEGAFRIQGVVDLLMGKWLTKQNPSLPVIHWVLSDTDLRFPVLHAFGLDAIRERILLERTTPRDEDDAARLYALATSALADRDYGRALERMERAVELEPRPGYAPMRLYLHLVTGREEEARELYAANEGELAPQAALLEWFRRDFGFEPAG